MADPGDTELKAAATAAYEQSRQIADQNKTLALLDKLYAISVETLAPVALARKVAVVIQTDFAFESVLMYRYDRVADTLALLGGEGGSVKQASADAFWKTVVIEQGMKYAENPVGARVRSTIAHPLVTGGKVIGAVMFSLNRVHADLTEFEQKSIRDVATVTAVALDKALLYEELKETNERQETLLHFVGHEVKNFLTKDMGALSGLVEGSYGTLPGSARELAERALVETQVGIRSVSELLQASNQKKGTVTYAMEPFDLKTLAVEVAESLRPRAVEKGLELIFKADNRSSYEMTGDRGQLGDHVLRNLIENAINFTQKGSIAVQLEKDGNMFILSVTDTGTGIIDEDKTRLFKEGGRGKDSLKYNAHSTGYGLFISKNIIEAHHGTIRAESEGEGKGSTFIVELPMIA